MEVLKHNDQLLAIIIPQEFQKEGMEFFTPNELSQQLAYMHYPAEKVILPHIHNEVPRTITHTLETLIIKRGILRVDFYSDNSVYLCSRILKGGDLLLLASQGHGFKVLEEVEMFEVKQGPYVGDPDKTRFDPIADADARFT